MTALSGWGYENWGANVFWAMAAMGVLALFIRAEPKSTRKSDSLNKAELEAQN